MAENIAGRLYGAPYFPGFSETELKSYYQTLKIDDIETAHANFRTIVKKRIDELKITENEAKKTMRDTASQVEQETIDLFFGDKQLLKQYLDAANDPRKLELDQKILELAKVIVDEAVKQRGEDTGKILNLTDTQIKNVYEANLSKKYLKSVVEDLMDMFDQHDEKDKRKITKAIKNVIIRNFLNPTGEGIELYSGREGGTVGEVASLLTLTTNTYVSKGINNIIDNLNNIKSVGGRGIKPDLTLLDMSFSVKNYGNKIRGKVKKFKATEIEIHKGTKLHNIIQTIQENIDPGFGQENPDIMHQLNEYWVNISYLYNYGYKDKDREIRDIFGELFRYYGIAFLVGGVQTPLKFKGESYLDHVQTILDNGKRALFLHIPGIGTIPMYVVLQELASAADQNDKSASIKINLNLSTKVAKETVDANNLGSDNQGVLVNGFTYYGSLFGGSRMLRRDESITNLLQKRYETYTQKLGQSTINMYVRGVGFDNMMSKSVIQLS